MRLRDIAGAVRQLVNRRSDLFPRLRGLGQREKRRPLVKPTPTNLRYFARTPCARRAINAIKNPIKHMAWEIVPRKNVKLNAEIQRQIDAVTQVFCMPNPDDSGGTFIEKVLEDYLSVSAGAYEQQPCPDMPERPAYMWPVDSQSIQIYPFWTGHPDEPRYCQVLNSGNLTSHTNKVCDLRDDELVYIAPNPSTSTPYGYGPLEITANLIHQLLGAGDYAGNVASNSQPHNLLWLGNIDQQTLNAFRAYWRDEIEGQGQTPLIGGPDEPTAVRLVGTGDEGLFLKWQEFLIRAISTGFDLSPQNFGLFGNASEGSAEAAQERDWEHAVKPMALTLKDFFTRCTIQKLLGFYSIEFSFPGLDREDEKRQAEIFELLYQNNMLLPDEARKVLGKEPLGEWGEKTYAEVQIAIGEARRGGVNDNAPDKLHNQPPAKLRQLRRQ